MIKDLFIYWNDLLHGLLNSFIYNILSKYERLFYWKYINIYMYLCIWFCRFFCLKNLLYVMFWKLTKSDLLVQQQRRPWTLDPRICMDNCQLWYNFRYRPTSDLPGSHNLLRRLRTGYSSGRWQGCYRFEYIRWDKLGILDRRYMVCLK
jgi:hypothetical protein